MDQPISVNAQIFDDLDALSRAAAQASRDLALDAIAARGRCAIALAGGNTPARAYALWTSDFRLPWLQTHFFWGDERYVAPDDPQSNFRMFREALLDRVAVPAENVHPMPTGLPKPEDAAVAYEHTLRQFFGSGPPAFDLILLGLGGEGHTASLFPGSPALMEKDRWVVAVDAPVEPHLRLTLTLPVLNRAREVIFLASGAGKSEVIASMERQPELAAMRYPAACIQPQGRVVWFLDRAAAAGLAR
jgi:6-phosphogluconolactonase